MKKSSTIILLVIVNFGFAQTVVHHPKQLTKLEQQWDWAVKKFQQDNDFKTGCWIGYYIERKMIKNSFIGRVCSHRDINDPSLAEMIYKNSDRKFCTTITPEEAVKAEARSVLSRSQYEHSDDEDIIVDKNLAFLFKMHPQQERSQHISDIDLSNMTLTFDFEGLPVLWLDRAEHEESFAFIKKIYSKVNSTDIKSDLIVAISLHEQSSRVTDFLISIISSREDNELREDAVFWLGQQKTPRALTELKKIAEKDRSLDVREKAIFAISQIDSEQSLDALIYFAKKGNTHEIREKAIFWMSQIASERTTKILTDVFEDDEEDIEIREKVIFALSQLDDNKGVPHLIKIAKSHHNPKLRKKAIFWLGQTEDKRAIDAIIEILRQ